MKKQTECMLFAAQEQALRTNAIKAKTDKHQVSSECRLCATKEETVMHLVSGCPSWRRNSKRRYDNVARSTIGIVQEAWTGKLKQVV